MKKITLKIAAIVLLSSVVFFACKKESPAPVVDPCTTLATTLATDILAAQTALSVYTLSQTNANCLTLYNAAISLKTKASACPAVLADPIIAGLIDKADTLPCLAK